MNSSMQRIALAFAFLFVAGTAQAATIRVSSNGADSGTCGKGNQPACATIAQAVANAADGDSIVVGAGKYAGAAVGKRLTLTSSNGNGGAVISGTMTLAADGIVFGKVGKGFSVSASANTAILASGDAVTVRGNRISDSDTGIDSTGADAVLRDNSFDNCGTAIRSASSGAQIRANRSGYTSTRSILLDTTSSNADVRENKTFGPSGIGVVIGGTGHLVRRNLIHGSPAGGFGVTGTPADVTLLENVVDSSSSPAYFLTAGTGWVLMRNAALNNNSAGFYLTSSGATSTLIGNIAIGNTSDGIYVANGSAHVLKDNIAIDNFSGIYLSSVGAGVTVTGGNLYGNSGNCGVSNSSASAVAVSKVYWGAASGPGADPADDICANVAAIVVTKNAAKAVPIKLPPVK